MNLWTRFLPWFLQATYKSTNENKHSCNLTLYSQPSLWQLAPMQKQAYLTRNDWLPQLVLSSLEKFYLQQCNLCSDRSDMWPLYLASATSECRAPILVSVYTLCCHPPLEIQHSRVLQPYDDTSVLTSIPSLSIQVQNATIWSIFQSTETQY